MEPSATGRVAVAIVATHIAPAKGYGGIAESVGRLARHWGRTAFPFSVCASDASEGPALRPSDLGLPDTVRIHLFHSPVLRKLGFGPGGILAVPRACLGAEIAYINGLGTWPTVLAKIVCVLARRPMLVALRAGLMPSHLATIRARKPVKNLLYRLVELPCLRRAAALHLTSPLEAEGLERLLPGVPVHVVPNGLDLAVWPALPPRPADGGLVLCYLGRLSPEKGILRFLRVWNSCRRTGDRLILAGGGDGPYAQAVRDEAERADGAVDLHPYLGPDDVRAVLRRSDFLVLPSGIENGDLRENFGNAAAEALASARPVLVTKGLAWDSAEENGFGLSFAADDAAIAAAIGHARSLSPERRAEMGRRGRAHAESHFDIAKTADTLRRIAVSLAGR